MVRLIVDAVADWPTYAKAALGAVITTIAGALATLAWGRAQKYVPGTEEYEQRIIEQKARDKVAQQENQVLFRARIQGCDFMIFSGDLILSEADILVSSDDTQLSASGGVAKAVVTRAGTKIRKRMRTLARLGIPKGSIVVTDGGSTPARYIFHAAMLHKTSLVTDFPTPDDVAQATRRLIRVGDYVGAESIALPVLASGTAAKLFEERNLGHDEVTYVVASSVIAALKEGVASLRTVSLIIFRKDLFNNKVKVRLEQQLAAA